MLIYIYIYIHMYYTIVNIKFFYSFVALLYNTCHVLTQMHLLSRDAHRYLRAKVKCHLGELIIYIHIRESHMSNLI